MSRVFKASAGIAQGIFVSLGIGLLIENIGRIVDIPLLITIGVVAKSLMAPAIGAGIALCSVQICNLLSYGSWSDWCRIHFNY